MPVERFQEWDQRFHPRRMHIFQQHAGSLADLICLSVEDRKSAGFVFMEDVFFPDGVMIGGDGREEWPST